MIKLKTTPYAHQQKALDFIKDKDAAALFMEMGTGKTKVTIDDASIKWDEGKINRVLVLAPNSIKSTWFEEIEKHCPIKYNAHVYNSKKKGQSIKWIKEHDGDMRLRFLIIGIESLSQGAAYKILQEYINTGDRAMIVVDESSTIKSHKAIRTRKVTALANGERNTTGINVQIRRILSGTPIAKGLEDLYSQYHFLDPDIINTKSYYVFRNRYCLMGGFQGKSVIGYYNEDHLMGVLGPHTIRVTKEEALDLPDKIYETRDICMNDEQKRMYKSMKQDLIAELNGEKVTAEIAVTKLLRLMQITGGFLGLPYEDERGRKKYRTEQIPGKNPKAEEVISILEQTGDKIIIWCKYVAEIEMLQNILTERKYDVVTAYGGNTEEENTLSRHLFQQPDGPRIYIGQPEGGGMGITLTAANTVIYYSNSPSFIYRAQSEDRAHRIGQKNNVVYIDLITRGTIDRKIYTTLRERKNFSETVLGAIESGGWEEIM